MIHTVYVDGFALAVLERGLGPPVLLVHGFPLDHRMWREQIDVLAAAYRVLAPDLRGFGESRGASGVTTMARFADDLAGILDQRQIVEPVALCGLSMGGYIAWEFWRRHQTRLGKLILCDTRAAPDTPEAAENRVALAQRVLAEGTGCVVDLMLPRLLSAETAHQQPQLVEFLAKMMRGAPSDGVAAALLGMARRHDARPWLRDIDVPTLVLVGEHDPISPPAEMREIATALPQATFHIIPTTGHMAPLESPDEVNKLLLDFLESPG